MKIDRRYIKPADIIFYRPKGLLSWLVAKITRSDYSHVALLVDQDTLIEANWFTKSRERKIEDVERVSRVYRISGLSEEDREDVVDYAYTLLGIRYDFISILGMVFRFVFDFDVSFLNKFNGFVCSTIIDKALYESGVKRKDKEYLFYISPQGLLDKYNMYEVQVIDKEDIEEQAQ